MDFANLTFIGLMTLGFVNVIGFWKPDLDSRLKFALSVIFAFGLTFVPVDFGNMLAEKLKEAIEVALAASGGYKLAQKVGGLQ